MLLPYHELLNSKKIILASASPQRLKSLEMAGLKVEVSPSDFEEDLDKSDFETTQLYVEKTSEMKLAHKIQSLKEEGKKVDIIITGDTIVSFDNQVFEKPRDAEHVKEVMTLLNGQTHQVFTAMNICILKDGEEVERSSFTDRTDVEFYPMTEE